ncbi:ATP-binding cassette domain-containing protein [Duganella violaceipulchra]|nr:ATP-binding cassette domain-containing protein [Duganella violaceicalia]MBV6322495.1 ATP-binding cassette domain-containing protein [Duganella violaceicalia]
MSLPRPPPQGDGTEVGERGGSLSGGQRQRVALARALLTDPRILILDEATSALDYESEAAIMRRLPEITAGRTVISIAHRLNTIRYADCILVMEDGRVVEQGSHDELLEVGGKYAELWRLQTVESLGRRGPFVRSENSGHAAPGSSFGGILMAIDHSLPPLGSPFLKVPS